MAEPTAHSSAEGDRPEPNASDAEAPESEAPDAETADAPRRTLNAVQEPKRLHPMTLLQRVLVSLPALAFLLYPALSSPNSEAWFSIFLSLVYGFIALPAIVLQYMRFSYRITPKEIVIQSGVINRKNRSIPLERVQNIQIEQSLLPRMMGTAKVKVETAGSSSTEGVLEYVSLSEAHSIRQAVRTFKRQQAAAELGADASDPEAATDEATEPAAETGEEIFAMPIGRVLLSGAFRFSLLYIALIFSGLQFVPAEDLILWMQLSQGELEGLYATAAASPWLTGLLTIFVAGLLSWLTGIAINLNKYYGFRLWLDGDKLRLRRGLLTLAEGTIPLQKVQTLILRTNPAMRQFGWYALEVQTVGLDVEEQGHRVVVPFAQKDEILKLAQHIRSFDLPESFESVSRLTIRRSFVRYSVALVTLTGLLSYGVYWIGTDWIAWTQVWWLLALAPLLLGLAILQYLYHGYAIQDDGFFVRRGVFRHYIWMIPVEKFHVFYTTASIFQRRLGLKSLFVDTAGAAAFAYPEVVDVRAEPADRGLADLYDQFRTLYDQRLQAATADPSSSRERLSIPEEELRNL